MDDIIQLLDYINGQYFWEGGMISQHVTAMKLADLASCTYKKKMYNLAP